jgi:hypothetical protein
MFGEMKVTVLRVLSQPFAAEIILAGNLEDRKWELATVEIL